MTDVCHEITVDCPLGVVRENLVEPDKVVRWQRNLVEYEFTTPGPPGEGSECRGVIAVMGRRIGWRAKVVEWGEGGYTLRSLGNGPRFELSWAFEPEGDQTKVTYCQSSPAFEGMTGFYVRGLVDKMATRDIERLKEALDGLGASGT